MCGLIIHKLISLAHHIPLRFVNSILGSLSCAVLDSGTKGHFNILAPINCPPELENVHTDASRKF